MFEQIYFYFSLEIFIAFRFIFPITNHFILTLSLLMWRIWWVPNNARKWQMGFISAFQGLRYSYFQRLITWQFTYYLFKMLHTRSCSSYFFMLTYSTMDQNTFLVSIIYFLNLFVCSYLKCAIIRHAVLFWQYKRISATINFIDEIIE